MFWDNKKICFRENVMQWGNKPEPRHRVLPEQEQAGLEYQLGSISSPQKDIPTRDLHKNKTFVLKNGETIFVVHGFGFIRCSKQNRFCLEFLGVCVVGFSCVQQWRPDLKLKPNVRRKRWLGCVAVYILWIGITCLAEAAQADGCERMRIKVGKMLQERSF